MWWFASYLRSLSDVLQIRGGIWRECGDICDIVFLTVHVFGNHGAHLYNQWTTEYVYVKELFAPLPHASVHTHYNNVPLERFI